VDRRTAQRRMDQNVRRRRGSRAAPV